MWCNARWPEAPRVVASQIFATVPSCETRVRRLARPIEQLLGMNKTKGERRSKSARCSHQAGCTKIFTDTASGGKAERVGLDEALSYIRPGDTLVVWRLDRLGRSLKHLIETITRLANREIGFKSITESIDTTTSGGKLVFHIFDKRQRDDVIATLVEAGQIGKGMRETAMQERGSASCGATRGLPSRRSAR
jgi:Resolvase, N terminal domain